MGYAFAMAPCFLCNRAFMFHPNHVPSVKDKDGVRQPLCLSCHDWANAERIKRGLSAWPAPHPRAYQPAEESEL